MHFYTDPTRARKTYALPDAEAFLMVVDDFDPGDEHTWMGEAAREAVAEDPDGEPDMTELAGWYWWACFPGCMPDGDGSPSGPFDTQTEAIADAQEY